MNGNNEGDLSPGIGTGFILNCEVRMLILNVPTLSYLFKVLS